MTVPPPKVNIFGTDVSVTSIAEVAGMLVARSSARVVIANVHSVMASRRDPSLADAIRSADVVTPDGVPLVWALRIEGHEAVRVTGIDVLRTTADWGREKGIRHYFYGSTVETLHSMVDNLEAEYPGIQIAGTLSPPFRDMTDDEVASHLAEISNSGADVVWVGLGMPKQEHWIHRIADRLGQTSVVGIGAAFDWIAGNQPMAPEWMRDRGLEWLFRLGREPRRLWRRYAYNNPAFLVLLVRRLLKRRVRGVRQGGR